MKKFLLTLIVLLISAVPSLSAKEIVLEKWKTGWSPALPSGYNDQSESTHTKDGLTLTVFNCSALNFSGTDKLQFAKSAGYIKIANIDGVVTSFDFYSFTQASTSAGVELKEITGDNESSIGTVKLTEADFTTKFSISIPTEKQGAGKIYKIANNTTKATQISKIVINIADNGPVDAEVTAAPISVVKGGKANIVLSGVPDVADLGELEYSVAAGSENFVSVSDEGEVTGLAETTEPAIVKIAWAGSDKYKPGQTTCDVTVTDPNYIGTITFDPASGTELTIGQEVTISCPGATNITWMGGENIMGEEKSDRAVVKITEACTLEVVATNAAGNSTTESATYTVREATESTFDFLKYTYGMTRYTSGSDYNETTNKPTYSFSDATGFVTISTNKKTGSGTRLWDDGFRTYKNAEITISVPDTHKITKIAFVQESGKSFYLSTTQGTFANKVWTPAENDEATNSVTFTNTTAGNTQGIKTLTVYFEKNIVEQTAAKVAIADIELNRTQTAKVELTGVDGTRVDRLGALTYTVDEECKDIISIDAEGTITPLAVGVAMYTVAWEASTFYTAGEELGMVTVTKVPAPAAPVFSVASGEVASGTVLTITCEGAEKLSYIIGETVVENATLPVELTITKACKISAYGVSIDGEDGETAEASYTIKVSRRFAPVASIEELNEETDYMVVGYIKSSNTYRAMGAYNSGTKYMEAKVTDAVNGGINEPDGAMMIRIVKNADGTVSFKIDGKYLEAVYNSNTLSLAENVSAASSLLLTKNEDNTFKALTTATATNGTDTEDRVLKFNASSPRFAFYKTTSELNDFYLCAPLANKHAVLSMVEEGDENGWDHIAGNSSLLVNTLEESASFIVTAETGYTVHYCIHRQGDAIVPEQPTEPSEPEQPASVMSRADHADDAAHTWTAVGTDNRITIPTGTGTLYLTTHNGVEYAEPKAIAYNIGANVQTGVEGVSVSTAEVVEWYTLEGIRVAEPAAGRIYIRRTAAGTTRVLVR